MDGSSFEYALLQYRNAPLNDFDRSPSQLLMGRNLRTKLPFIRCNKSINNENRHNLMDRQKKKQRHHDRTSMPLKPLQSGDVVRFRTVRDQSQQAVERYHAKQPRSHVVETENVAILLRNRRDLILTRELPPLCERPDDCSSLPTPSSSETDDTANAPDNNCNALVPSNSTIQRAEPSHDDTANLSLTFSSSTASLSISSVDVRRTRSGRLVTLPSKVCDYSLT